VNIQALLRTRAPFEAATRIVVAHRLNNIADADKVLVLAAGCG
jgi:ABC-type transport system involved in Fe-S cluster assembly fused permease/ATPase subunit